MNAPEASDSTDAGRAEPQPTIAGSSADERGQLQNSFVHARRAEREFRQRDENWIERQLHRGELILRTLVSGLIGKLLGIRKMSGPIEPALVKSVLILRHDAIGDMVVTTPMWRTIKHLAPHIRIGVVCSFRNHDVLRCDPDVDVLFDLSDKSLAGILRGIRKVRREKWDVVFPLVYRKRTIGAFISRLCSPKGCTSTVIHEGRMEHYSRFHDIVATEREVVGFLPMVDRLHDHLFGVLKFEEGILKWHPSMVVDPKAVKTVGERVEALYERTGAARFVLINTESANEFREWGSANDFALSERIVGMYPDMLVLWSSSPTMAHRAEMFLSAHSNPRILYFGTCDIHEVAALIRCATLVVSPDTSITHIASSEHKPVVGLHVIPNDWDPYGVPSRVLRPLMHQPVNTIPLEDVFNAVRELLPE